MDLAIETICGGMVGFLKAYIILVTLRVYLTWFPNVNFFEQPFFSLCKLTDPFLRLFRGLIPAIVGFDISPILAFLLLQFLLDVLESLAVLH